MHSELPEAPPILSEGVKGPAKLFTKDFTVSTVANFTNAFAMQMLVATLPVYVLLIGGSEMDVGMVSGALPLTALLLRPFVGWVTDAWRRRPVVLIGTSCYGFASVIYLIAGSTVPFLLLGRVVNGFGVCCYTTASNAYIADIVPFRRRAEAVGIFSAAQAVGLIIGPAMGFYLAGRLGYHNLFYFSAGMSVLAFIISLFAKERRAPRTEPLPRWSPRTDLVSIEALPVAWMALCMGMGFGAISTFVAIFAQGRGMENPGFYFMIQACALLISRTFGGRLADLHGRAVAIVPGVILASAAFFWLPFAHSFFDFAISGALFGFGFGIAQPATMALLLDRVSSETRGFAIGTYFAGFDAGIFAGAVLLGVVGHVFGLGAMWPIAGICALLALLGLCAGGKCRK